jgi:hypothetical protein
LRLTRRGGKREGLGEAAGAPAERSCKEASAEEERRAYVWRSKVAQSESSDYMVVGSGDGIPGPADVRHLIKVARSCRRRGPRTDRRTIESGYPPSGRTTTQGFGDGAGRDFDQSREGGAPGVVGEMCDLDLNRLSDLCWMGLTGAGSRPWVVRRRDGDGREGREVERSDAVWRKRVGEGKGEGLEWESSCRERA